MGGGKKSTCGTPQGGVISPLLANLYMNRFLKYWRIAGRCEVFQAQIINYADDFVILSRGCAVEALNWTRSVMARIGLTLNEAKTSIRSARTERFDFLGYTFGPHCYRKTGARYIGASPSTKSVARLRQKVGDLLRPRTEVRGPMCATTSTDCCRAGRTIFDYGSRTQAYLAVDNYVYERVRNFLRRRHKVPSLGSVQFSRKVVYGKLGVHRLMPRATSVC